jgi:hypothetical protein
MKTHIYQEYFYRLQLKYLVVAILAAIVWIPYFMSSRRVKEVFTTGK